MFSFIAKWKAKNLAKFYRDQRLSEFIMANYHRDQRLSELNMAMDKLIAEHMVVNSIQDYHGQINSYAYMRDSNEYEYCKNYIQSKVNKSYERYDNERLRG
jgi:hypothetical protein